MWVLKLWALEELRITTKKRGHLTNANSAGDFYYLYSFARGLFFLQFFIKVQIEQK